MKILTGVARLTFAASLIGSIGLQASPALALPNTDAIYPHVANAYKHLDEAMDEWGKGSQLRLPSSYHKGEKESWNPSVIYDDALTIIAYANRSDSPESLERAKNMGNTILELQAKDPAGDGRIRNAYMPDQLFLPNGRPNITSSGPAAGNMAWAGMALAHLAKATGDAKYQQGAAKIGEWLLRETSDSRGAGGFTGGYKIDGTKATWKSTEHNIDMIGLFGMLHELSGDAKWEQARSSAEKFVRSMWNNQEGRFSTGTQDDGVTSNDSEYIPEDIHSWAVLALGDQSLNRGLDWAVKNLETTDKSTPNYPFTGTRYALQIVKDRLDRNDNVVWLEGTAHMALALKCSAQGANAAKSKEYLKTVETAQVHGPNADGKGIQADTSVGYSGGSGGDEMAHTSLHIGATSWYIMAAQGINPLRLGTRC